MQLVAILTDIINNQSIN